MTKAVTIVVGLFTACMASVALADSPSLPALLQFSPSRSTQSPFAIRPRTITLCGATCVYFIAGAKRQGREPISWSRWTATQALGSGAGWMDNCTPNCAEGHYNPHSVMLRAYDPKKGHFARLWVRELNKGKWHSHTYKLTYDGGWWEWQ